MSAEDKSQPSTFTNSDKKELFKGNDIAKEIHHKRETSEVENIIANKVGKSTQDAVMTLSSLITDQLDNGEYNQTMDPKSEEGYVASKLKESELPDHKTEPSPNSTGKYELAYFPILTFSYIHLAALYGIYLCFTSAKWNSIAFGLVLYIAADIGITAGVHRLWSHRSYKAKMPLQIILMVFNTLAFQNTAIYWVRDHRLHHKYCDTDLDPHNASRGFFYAHIGWQLTRKSEKLIQMGKTIDMTDIYSNPVLRFQKKYAVPLITTVCFVLPTIIPVYFWGESISIAWHINILRYAVLLNASWLINSAAHMWGFKPYDKNILPAENIFVSWITLGEGFHNFHHTFPWDYQAAELGNYKFNISSWFIDFFAWVGWAYDLKKVPKDLVQGRGERTGDGSNLWGWGDKGLKEEHKKSTKIIYPE